MVKLNYNTKWVECISNIFHELGAGGVVVRPQLLLYAKEEWDDYEFPKTCLCRRGVVKGYLPIDQFLLTKLENLKNK